MRPLRWNTERLVHMSVAGEVAPSMLPGRLGGSSFFVGHAGMSQFMPPWGGVTRNVAVGDPARGWIGERVEPGVSITNRDHAAATALLHLACIGNTAAVMSGRGQGAQGVVTGKHGRFAETVITRFPHETLEKLATGDRIVVVAAGTGLSLIDYPQIRFKSIAPHLAEKLIVPAGDGIVEVKVRAVVPPEIAGAGLGLSSDAGSLSIQTADERMLQRHGLEDLRLGDVVAFQHIESRWTNCFRRHACTVAVVSAGDSVQAGFGIVTTPVATARDNMMRPIAGAATNIVDWL